MRQSRRIRLGSIVCTALLLALWSTGVAQAVNLKKYTADVSPHSVSTSSTVTYTLTVNNKAVNQTLGSCNLTLVSGFTLQSTSQPSSGTATVAGNVLQLRNLAIPAMTSRTVAFVAKAPATPGTYTHGIVCRQANNFNPQTPSNEFAIDAANSNLKTTVSTPVPQADVAVTGNTASQEPVTGSNTVVYSVLVHNFGPATSGALTLVDSLPAGGSITSTDGGPNWTCSGSGASASCAHAALANGADTEILKVYVLAPDADTTITNRASVSESVANDPNAANNTVNTNTTVQKNTTCSTGTVSCGSGTITYNLPSQVRSCLTPSALVFICGNVSFNATTATGSQIYNLYSPAVAESVCPVSLTSNAVTACDWQVNLDVIPLFYPTGYTTAVFTCHASRCPVGPVPGAGTVVVHIAEDGSHSIMPRCSGPSDTNRCYDQARTVGGDLQITVRNMPPGDPKIAGRCVAGC